MRFKWAVGFLLFALGADTSAIAKTPVTCKKLVEIIWSPYGTRYIYAPCIVTKANTIDFFGTNTYSFPTDNGHAGSWVASLPENETGAIYLETSDSAVDFRNVVRGAKPYIEGASYFGSLFSEPLANYYKAAINRNATVDANLSQVRWAATRTSNELGQEKSDRNNGLHQVSVQQSQKLEEMVKDNAARVASANATASDLASRLSSLPQPKPPEDLASLGSRNKIPQDLTHSIAEVVDAHTMVGSVSLISGVPPSLGLANAADLELKEYEQLSPQLRMTQRLKEGAEALKQAKYFAPRNPELARILYAEGCGARAFALGKSKKDEVASWDVDQTKFVWISRQDSINRALHFAVLFGDRATKIRAEIINAAGGVTQRPPDTTLRITEQLVSDAEQQLDSDPVKSLGGLFRARTLIQNVKLYGGAWAKLTAWTVGAAKRLVDAFYPPPLIKEPGGLGKYVALEVSKRLKHALTAYSKSIEAGDYAAIGISKVSDIFGSQMLEELKESLRDAYEAVGQEAKPLAGLDKLAPTVELWVSKDARLANEANSKSEIAQLMKLYDLYTERTTALRTYVARLEALSELSNFISSQLDSPALIGAVSARCYTSLCAQQVMAVKDQHEEVANLAKDTKQKTEQAIKRYELEIEKIEELIDGWLLVLPDSPSDGYPVFGAPIQRLRSHFP